MRKYPSFLSHIEECKFIDKVEADLWSKFYLEKSGKAHSTRKDLLKEASRFLKEKDLKERRQLAKEYFDDKCSDNNDNNEKSNAPLINKEECNCCRLL